MSISSKHPHKGIDQRVPMGYEPQLHGRMLNIFNFSARRGVSHLDGKEAEGEAHLRQQ